MKSFMVGFRESIEVFLGILARVCVLYPVGENSNENHGSKVPIKACYITPL